MRWRARSQCTNDQGAQIRDSQTERTTWRTPEACSVFSCASTRFNISLWSYGEPSRRSGAAAGPSPTLCTVPGGLAGSSGRDSMPVFPYFGYLRASCGLPITRNFNRSRTKFKTTTEFKVNQFQMGSRWDKFRISFLQFDGTTNSDSAANTNTCRTVNQIQNPITTTMIITQNG